MKHLIISIVLLLLCNMLPAAQLKVVDKVYLSSGGGDDFLKAAACFAVTENGLYLIFDYKEGDIKVFDIRGHFVKRFGRRGHGPNEFITPRYCDYRNRQLLVMDAGANKYTLFDMDKESLIKESKIVRAIYMGTDIRLMNRGKMLVSGFRIDGDKKEWSLYSYDFYKKRYLQLVRNHLVYGFKTEPEYRREETKISTIRSSSLCDVRKGYAYHAWSGDLRIFKVDLETKEIKSFGHKTATYHKPVYSDELRKALLNRDLAACGKITDNYSFILGLYTTRDYLMVVYERPKQAGEKVKSRMLQFYTLEGVFINEVQLTHGEAGAMYVRKDNDDIFYLLQLKTVETEEDFEDRYSITRLKIIR